MAATKCGNNNETVTLILLSPSQWWTCTVFPYEVPARDETPTLPRWKNRKQVKTWLFSMLQIPAKALQIWVCAWPRFRTTWPTWHLGTVDGLSSPARTRPRTPVPVTCIQVFLGHKSILTRNYQFTDTCKCYVSSVKLVQNILPSTSGWCIIHMNLHLTSFQFGSQELPINCTNSSCFKENPLRCTRNIENPTPLFASAPLATVLSNRFWIPVILFLFYFSVIHSSMTRTPS